VDPLYLSIPDGLKFRCQQTLFKLCEKALIPLHCILQLENGTGGLAVIRAIVIIVPFITLFALDEVSFLVPVFKMVVCIFVVDYVVQVSFILISATLLRGSDDAGRVPAGALAMVRVLTPPLVSTIKGRVNHCSYIQHCSEALDLLAVFR
jgi:hypothetical protein